MTTRAICVAVLLSTLPAAGCGTVSNLTQSNPDHGGKIPFGGVKQDLACLQKPNEEPNGKAQAEHHSQTMLKFLCAADLPFSLVGDLVTWPYTTVYSTVNEPVTTPAVTFADPSTARPIPPAREPMPLPVPPKQPPTLPPTDVKPKTSAPDLPPKIIPLP